MDLQDPMVSFVKRQAIASILNKLQVPALTSRVHYISGTATLSACSNLTAGKAKANHPV